MSFEPDTSTRIAGVIFKSPLLVSSSELAFAPPLLDNLLETAAGGVVTKTFTSLPENRIRVRPYQFPLNAFGRGYKEAGCLYSLAAPHVENMARSVDHVREMVKRCHQASVKLIASFFEDPTDLDSWLEYAKAFEEAGADMIELNFSSPSAFRIFARNSEISVRIVKSVKENLSVPIGLKLGPTLEPLEEVVASWAEAELDFITAHNAPGGILIDVEHLAPFGAPVIGGYVSGRTFLPYSLARVVRIQKASSIPVIGVGGIYNATDALQYLLAGCPLVGLGSALYFRGPGVLDEIYEGLVDWMQKKAFRAIHEFRGMVLPMIKSSESLKESEPYPFVTPPDCPYMPVVSEAKCNRCGLCAKACIYGAIEISQENWAVKVNEERCWSCGFCVGICPFGALELRDRRDRNKLIWNNQGTANPFKPGHDEKSR